MTAAVVFVLLAAGAIAAHRFQPDNWPALGIAAMHSLHGTGFALLALLILGLLQTTLYPSSFNYLVAAGLTMSVGLVSEILQIPGPRDAHIDDLIMDGLGTFGGLGIVAVFDSRVRDRLSRPIQLVLPVAAACSLVIACAPTIWLTYALIQQQRAFPDILTFERAWERATYTIPRNNRPELIDPPENWLTADGKVGRLHEIGRRRIFLNVHSLPDWEGYGRFSFIAASAGEPFSLDVRFRETRRPGSDSGPARSHKSVLVGANPERFTITFEEIASGADDGEFDFSRMDSVVLNATGIGAEGNAVMLLDNVKLEP